MRYDIYSLNRFRNWTVQKWVRVAKGDGWALMVPDPEEPVTHVWAEAGSDAEARELAQEHARRIRQILR